MSSLPITAVLMCKSGALAGSTLDLGAETIIGRDEAGRIVFASGSRLHTRDARIFMRDGAYHVENLGEPGLVLVDGIPVRGTVTLGRLHVIELAEGTFMYSQRATVAPVRDNVPDAAGPRPTPAAAAGHVARVTPPDGHGTTVDPGGFEPIPTLRTNVPGQRGTTVDPGGVDPVPAARTLVQGEHGTVVDAGAFDAVPSLQQRWSTAAPSADDAQTRVYQPPSPEPPLQLSIKLPGLGLTTFPLKYGDNVIGRGAGCDIRLDDAEKWLSRRHANLSVADERVELIDLQGSNGTFVHGVRVTTAVLVPGTRFTLGPQFEFSLEKR